MKRFRVCGSVLVFSLAIYGCGNSTLIPPKPTATLSVSSSLIEPGQSATLSWNTTRATSITLSPIGEVQPNGQLTVAPKTTTQYTLTASGAAGTTESSVTVTPVSIIFSDSFDRPDQMGLGLTPQGQNWFLTGPGYLIVAISNHHYVAGTPTENNSSYAGIEMNTQPLRLGGMISFLPHTSGGGVFSAVALISSKDNGIKLANMVHLVATSRETELTWWQGADQNNPPASCTGSLGYSAPLRTDGTSYPLYMTIEGDTVTVEKPDGASYACTDPHFSQVAGSFGIWELWYSMNTIQTPRWDKAEAFAAIK